MALVEGEAFFESDLEAFRSWSFFLPKGPSEDLDRAGTYVKWRSLRNPKFFDTTLAKLRGIASDMRIEAQSSAGVRSETALRMRGEALRAQRIAMGFLHNR